MGIRVYGCGCDSHFKAGGGKGTSPPPPYTPLAPRPWAPPPSPTPFPPCCCCLPLTPPSPTLHPPPYTSSTPATPSSLSALPPPPSPAPLSHSPHPLHPPHTHPFRTHLHGVRRHVHDLHRHRDAVQHPPVHGAKPALGAHATRHTRHTQHMTMAQHTARAATSATCRGTHSSACGGATPGVWEDGGGVGGAVAGGCGAHRVHSSRRDRVSYCGACVGGRGALPLLHLCDRRTDLSTHSTRTLGRHCTCTCMPPKTSSPLPPHPNLFAVSQAALMPIPTCIPLQPHPPCPHSPPQPCSRQQSSW